jgi:hypothetical protein
MRLLENDKSILNGLCNGGELKILPEGIKQTLKQDRKGDYFRVVLSFSDINYLINSIKPVRL